MRVKITLACTECKQRNYNTMKNKKNSPDRLEMKKLLPYAWSGFGGWIAWVNEQLGDRAKGRKT